MTCERIWKIDMIRITSITILTLTKINNENSGGIYRVSSLKRKLKVKIKFTV